MVSKGTVLALYLGACSVALPGMRTDGQFALITVLGFTAVRTVVPSSVKVADHWVVVLVAPPVSLE